MVSEKDIKKINQRLVQMRDTFGEDSIAVKRYQEAMEAVIPSEYLIDRKKDIEAVNTGTLKKPLISISHGKKARENIEEYKIAQLLQKPTARDIIAHEKAVIAEEMGVKPSAVKMQDVIAYDKEKSDVLKWIEDHPSEQYSALRMLQAIKQPTYSDMMKAIDRYERGERLTDANRKKIRHRNQQTNYRRRIKSALGK